MDRLWGVGGASSCLGNLFFQTTLAKTMIDGTIMAYDDDDDDDEVVVVGVESQDLCVYARRLLCGFKLSAGYDLLGEAGFTSAANVRFPT